MKTYVPEYAKERPIIVGEILCQSKRSHCIAQRDVFDGLFLMYCIRLPFIILNKREKKQAQILS